MRKTKPTVPVRFPWSAHARVMAARSAATRKRLRADRLQAEASRLRAEAAAFDTAAAELAVDRDALR
jgi:hypothetical protein